MASTNKTTNYNLSQFIGSDKPAWLTDYNQDMSKIDTGIKSADDAANVADGKADTNAANIGNLANLNTQAKTNMVAAVNEVYNTAGTAAGTAQTAATSAASAVEGVEAVNDYLNLTVFTDYNYDDAALQKTNVTTSDGYIKLARNRLGTLGKVYGRIRGTMTAGWSTGKITINVDTGFKPDQEIEIAGGGMVVTGGQYDTHYTVPATIKIKTDGKIEISFGTTDTGENGKYQLYLYPCLYFIKNFGDTYDPGQGQ